MMSLEYLLSKRMVIRKTDPDMYYRIKDDLKPIRRFMQDKFGYTVVLTPLLIKLEKIPAIPEIWMGIDAFESIMEYQMFLSILMFLEDKEIEEQFVLSHITEFVFHQFDEGLIDWTNYSTRRRLVRVIKFCIKNNIIISNDGDENKFTQDYTTEVLYENTGISRYFVRNFSRDITQYKDHEDFRQSDWVEVDEDRGLSRRHRVYRKLLLTPALYKSMQEEDFLYLKNYRKQIQTDFESHFECDIHIHKSSAYLVLDETSRMGNSFPENNAYSDLVLLLGQKIREDVLYNENKEDEQISINLKNLQSMVMNLVKSNINYLPKTVQKLGSEVIAINTIEYMKDKGFINLRNDVVSLYPILGKVTGAYIREVEA